MSHQRLHADAVRALSAFEPFDAEQSAERTRFLQHLGEHHDGLSRDCHPSHLTASMLVVSADRTRVMLNLHRKFDIWVQFGGHCEAADTSLAAAALREAIEESGIRDLRMVSDLPTQLSTHEVRCGPVRPAFHLDVRYVAHAPVGATPAVSAESLDVRWFEPDQLPPGIDAPLRQLIDIALAPRPC